MKETKNAKNARGLFMLRCRKRSLGLLKRALTFNELDPSVALMAGKLEKQGK